MNNLSWFLYLAEVLPNMATLLTIAGWIGGILLFTAAGVRYIAAHDNSRTPKEIRLPASNFLKFVCYKVIPVFIFLVFIGTLIPSKETIYLIAGSEASEYVVTSEYGQEVLGDIKSIIKAQLEGMKETTE